MTDFGGTPVIVGKTYFIGGVVRRIKPGMRLGTGGRTTRAICATGLTMFVLLMMWPGLFFPFVWLSLVCVLEAVNVWLGNRSLTEWTARGDWRPVVSLALGALVCGLFWEMWNFWSYPKWVYHVPMFGFAHVFEMPLLGYLGYIPFSWELFAMVHLAFGLAGRPRSDYVVRGLAR